MESARRSTGDNDTTGNDEHILDAIDRAVNFYGFCPNRIWAVASSHPDKQRILPLLFPEENDSLRKALCLGPATGQTRHQAHAMCSLDFCELSQLNYTSVSQRHEDGHCAEVPCTLITHWFPRTVLDQAARNGDSTAWHLQALSTVRSNQKYMAISHVWSDGTGAGVWPSGHINGCLYYFFSDLARSLDCDGIWWDTLCIPQDKAARAIAINNMHQSFENAACTLVHDCFLRDVRYVDRESACIAILMSPWFSRGWTALEFASSRAVYVLLKGESGPIAVNMDELLDNPQTEAHRLAADILNNFRQREVLDINRLLQILGPRYTSWKRDMVIIAGLLAGIKVDSTAPMAQDQQSEDVSQQELTTRILCKLQHIERGQLFHGLPTVASGSSWCPAQLLSLPLDRSGDILGIDQYGNIVGKWRVLPVDSFDLNDFQWDQVHPLIAPRLRRAYRHAGDHVCLLEPKSEVERILLVRREHERTRHSCYWLVGCLYLKQTRGSDDLSFTEETLSILNVGGEKVAGEFRANAISTETATASSGKKAIHVHHSLPIGPQRRLRAAEPRPSVARDGVQDPAALIALALPQYDGFLSLDIDPTEPQKWLAEVARSWPGIHAPGGRDLGPSPEETQDFLCAAKAGDDNAIVDMLCNRSILLCCDSDDRTAVSWAAGNGHWKCVQLLLDSWMDDGGNEQRCQSFAKSAWNNQQISVRLYCNAMDSGGRTPLSWAAGEGHAEVVTLMLRYPPVAAELASACGWTPLWYAADNDKADAVQCLLDAGANIHHTIAATVRPVVSTYRERGRFEHNRITLSFAAQHSMTPSLLALFLRNGAAARDFAGRLWDAILNGDALVVQMLLDAGLRPAGLYYAPEIVWQAHDEPNLWVHGYEESNIWSPLDLAVQEGDGNIVELMIDSDVKLLRSNNSSVALNRTLIKALKTKSDIRLGQYRWGTYYAYAADRPRPSVAAMTAVIESIINKSKEAANELKIGDGVLQQAVLSGEVDFLKQLLSNQNVNVNSAPEDEPHALHLAIRSHQDDMVSMFLAHRDIDINLRLYIEDETSETPLHMAIWNPHSTEGSHRARRILEMLLANEMIDVEASANPFHASCTPLYKAADLGNAEAVEMLLAHAKIDVNTRDEYDLEQQWTPLIVAASEGHVGVVRALLKRPEIDTTAKVEWGDEYGSYKGSVADLAKQKGHREVARILQEYMDDHPADTDSVFVKAAGRIRSQARSKIKKFKGPQPASSSNAAELPTT